MAANDIKEGSTAEEMFMVLEILFCVLFTIELSLNIYANWFWGFWKDSWNVTFLHV